MTGIACAPAKPEPDGFRRDRNRGTQASIPVDMPVVHMTFDMAIAQAGNACATHAESLVDQTIPQLDNPNRNIG